MKTWRRFLAVFLTIAMLLPMTAVSEALDELPAMGTDLMEGAAAEATENTAVEHAATEEEAPNDNEESGEEVSSDITDAAVPELQEVELSEDGAESNDEASEANQEPVQKEVDFTAKKIELNMDKGTTLLVVPVNGTVQEPWSVPKAANGNVTTMLRADGVTEITAKSPIKKVKLSAMVLLSTGKSKKINMTLNVNDPNAPRAITLRGMPTGGVPVGRMLDLSQYIVLDPPSATLDSVEIKVSGSGKFDSSQYPYGMITTKKGSAKIAITSRSDKKVKMKPFSLKVLDNKTAKMTPKPGKADMPNGWTMWPVSMEVKGNVLKCQFNVINGTNDKMAQIENMTIKVAEGRWGNIIAEGTLPKVSTSVAKQKSKTVKFDLKINSENMKDVFLPEAWANQTLHFLINQGTVKLTGKKGESADFVYSKYFPEPGVDSSITLNRTEATMTVGGENLTLIATVAPTDLAYGWTSSNANVATVTGGVVKAVNAGTAVITAAALDGSAQAQCLVTVTNPVPQSIKVTGITLNQTTATITKGGTFALTATALPANATNKTINWSSTNTAVATVSNGVVTAMSAGTANIEAIAVDGSGIKAICEVTVIDDKQPTSVSIAQGEKISVTEMEKVQLEAVLNPDTSETVLKWKTSDETIAIVENGLVTALKEGIAIITVETGNGCKDECEVTVNALVEEIESPNANMLMLDDPWLIAVSEEYDAVRWFSFVPDQTGEYIFYCKDADFGDSELSISLYNENWKLLDSADTCGGDGKLDISSLLKSGERYYYRLGSSFCEDDDEPGVFSVGVRRRSGLLSLAAIDGYGDTASVDIVDIADGESITLQTKAETEGSCILSYQWYLIDESGIHIIDGATTDSYTLYNPKAYKYICLASDEQGYDAKVTFIVDTWPGIECVEQQEKVTVNMNGTAVLNGLCNVKHGGLRYQWFKGKYTDIYTDQGEYDEAASIANLEIISGATSANYTTGAITRNSEYTCRVTNDFGSSVYLPFQVILLGTPTVSIKGDRHEYIGGEYMRLEAVVEGGQGKSFQWYRDDHPIEGATDAVYSAVAVHGRYSCCVTDTYGNLIKSNNSYWIKTNHLVVSDEVTKQKFPYIGVIPNEPFTMTVQAECDSGNVTYQWKHDDEPIEGETKRSYTAQGIEQHHDKYSCEVKDEYGNSETVSYYVKNDNRLDAKAVGDSNLKVEVNQRVTLAVDASCAKGDLTYQWYRYNSRIIGATKSIFTVRPSGSLYKCIVSDEYGSQKTVEFNTTVLNDFDVTPEGALIFNIAMGESATMAVHAQCETGELFYDWFENCTIYDDDETITYNKIIPDAKGASYTATKAGKYECEVRDQYGNKKSIIFSVAMRNP